MRRLIKLIFIAAVVVAFAGAVYAALAARDLAAARGDLKAAKSDTRAFRFEEAEGRLDKAEDRLERARKRLDSLPLAILSRAPFVGRNIRAVDAIAEAAQHATAGARFALRAADALPAQRDFHVERGRFPDVDWRAVRKASDEATASFADAESTIRPTADDDLLGIIANARDEFITEVTEAHATARNLALGAAVLPDLLGQNGDRHHLIVIQNAAERRATGGAIESFMLLRARDGTIDIVRADPDEAIVGSSDDVDAAHRLNTEPDFTQIGLRIADAYAEATETAPDTVIALDQVAIGHLLGVTGALDVDGHQIDSANAVRFLSKDVFDAYPVEPGQSVFLSKLTRELSGRLLGNGIAIPRLVEQIARAAAGKHILVWARDAQAQKAIETLGVSGAAFFDREATEPFVTAVIGNNPSPAEMDYYARRTIHYDIFLHEGGTADVSAKVTVRNAVKRGELPGIVYGKSGGGMLRQEIALYTGGDRAPPVEVVNVKPGEEGTATFPAQEIDIPMLADGVTITILKQSGLFDDRLELVVHLPPRAKARVATGFTRGTTFTGVLDRDLTFTVAT